MDAKKVFGGIKKKIVTAFLFVGTFANCTYNVEEELYGACSTAGVTYSVTIKNILDNNTCTSCHGGVFPSGNISLENYPAVRTQALNGKLFGAVNHSPGFSAMPQGGSKINPCEIAKIKAWIDAGAPQN